jgi:hypothetical protein
MSGTVWNSSITLGKRCKSMLVSTLSVFGKIVKNRVEHPMWNTKNQPVVGVITAPLN